MAFEVSDSSLIASNVIDDNGAVGLKISGASNVRVWNNTLVNNATAQLGVYEDARTNTNTRQVASGVTWDTAAVALQRTSWSRTTVARSFPSSTRSTATVPSSWAPRDDLEHGR